MSVSMSKAEGVTVLTLTSDPQSLCPPLCQILKTLCWSPACCSLNRQLGARQRAMSALGSLQIMVGLFNIGLAVILMVSNSGSSWQMDSSGYPYWMGGIFILFGIFCILTEKFPNPCLVIFNVMLHLAGVCFAITAIVLYSINIGDISMWWWCHRNDYDYRSYDDYDGYHRRTRTTTPSTGAEGKKFLKENCLQNAAMMLMVLRGINAILIILAVLELCVVISVAVLQIKALACSGRQQKKAPVDPELYRPLLEEASVKTV